MVKSFYKAIELEIPDGVYEPREDSFLLAETLEKEKLKGKKVLEMGCGSGILSIISAKKGAEVFAADIDENSLECARKNSAANKAKINFLQSDLFLKISGKFSLIIFNPPYLPEEISDFSRTWAGGKNLEIIFSFISQVKNFLAPKGEVLIAASSLSGVKKIMERFHSEGLPAEIISEKKIPWETLFIIRAQKPNL